LVVLSFECGLFQSPLTIENQTQNPTLNNYFNTQRMSFNKQNQENVPPILPTLDNAMQKLVLGENPQAPPNSPSTPSPTRNPPIVNQPAQTNIKATKRPFGTTFDADTNRGTNQVYSKGFDWEKFKSFQAVGLPSSPSAKRRRGE
jgi:hypothetical protein